MQKELSDWKQFQSTPPRGWRRLQELQHNKSWQFQSTPPRGWRRELYPCKPDIFIFQSTPPRGWRPIQSPKIFKAFKISIHSTTRVETIECGNATEAAKFQSTPPRGWRPYFTRPVLSICPFQSTPPRGWRQQYYTITTTILQHISTNKSYPTPSNHGQPSLHTRKSVLIVQIFRCESPRKSMFASGSHQNTLYRFTARGQVRISAVLPH